MAEPVVEEDDWVVDAMARMAARNGRTPEEEHRAILEEALFTPEELAERRLARPGRR